MKSSVSNFSLRHTGRSVRMLAIAACLAAMAAPAAAVSNVVLSQIYGGGGNSGATYRNDYIELFNRGTTAVSINGWSVQYASASGNTWQVTPLPALTLQPGQYLLVQQAAGSGGTTNLPVADASGSIAMSSTAGKVVLANSVTPVADVRAASVLDAVGFGTANAFEGSAPTPAPRNSSTPFVICSGVNPPGVHTIPQIQGSGTVSPYAGTRQTTEGIVTHKVGNGFYLQDPSGDGDQATSDGIFVFTGSAPSVNVGDRVRLIGTVTEFNAGNPARPLTELTGLAGLTVLSSGHANSPMNMALPLASADEFERYEGMLVRFTAPLTVSQNHFQGRYGQVTLSAGRLEKPTNRNRPGTPQAIAAGNVKVASFNVLNYFTTFADGTTAAGESGQGCREGATVAASKCRGASNLCARAPRSSPPWPPSMPTCSG